MRHLRLLGQEELGVIPLPDATAHVKLTPASAKVISIPDGAKFAHFSCGVEFFVAENAAASLPTTTVTEGVIERNPAIRALQGGSTTIGVISNDTGYLTVSFYG